MTTTVDPTGTPAIYFNRSGTTIVAVTATGTTQGGGAAIPAASGWTVARVSAADSSNKAVVLPSEADVGDLVEIYATGVAITVFPPSGESIGSGDPNGGVGVGANAAGHLFRKLADDLWGYIQYSA